MSKQVPPRFPTDSAIRKEYPVAEGFLDYFPDAVMEVSNISKKGNDQHNPGQPIHWARGKSMDHANCIVRHLMERGTIDPIDGARHSAKLAWRAMALLQEELEQERCLPPSRGCNVKTADQDTKTADGQPSQPKPLAQTGVQGFSLRNT